MRIPIPDLLIRLRNEAHAGTATALRGSGAARSPLESVIWRGWALTYGHPTLYRIVSWFISRGSALAPSRQGAWTRSRTPLKPARKRLRDLLAERTDGKQ